MLSKQQFFFFNTRLINVLKNKINTIYLNDHDLILDLNLNDLYISLYFLKNISFFKYDLLLNMYFYDTNFLNRTYIIYNLMSTKYDKRLFLRVLVPKTFIVPSIGCLYRSANWLEREIWDLCGIFFYSHMDLRRILTDYGFEGNPLRKNFPVMGFYEVFFDLDLKAVIYTFLEASQELRFYEFKSPWDYNIFE